MQVIVLGGGLMGTATAFFLARRGIRVRLIERGYIGAGATVASFGNIRRTGRALEQMALAHRSLALWTRAEDLLGRDVEFRATGHLRLIFDEEGRADMVRFAAAARPLGLTLEHLEAAEVHRRFPGLGPTAIGASFSPKDGSANPRLVGPAFAAAAARAGAEIVARAGDVRITRTEAGFEVDTAQGSFGADVLVNCTGSGGRAIARQFGEDVPLTPHGPQMGVTEPLPHRILPVVGMWARDGGAYLRQVERGNVVFGGGVTRVPVDGSGYAKYDPAGQVTQLQKVVRLCPALADVAVIRNWSGNEGYTADMLPVMGASGTTPGLFHAFGFCGHGFQLGPGVGDAMAELIATGTCETPIAAMAITRFAA
ncbi:NAD(P)/FAD-dependent oxidoreductase [Alloyangia pacifica]|uniref:Sarcosine oxidase subunit beta n=1 Tax=Alloyangia pacifica TaxID=311180 RepID=A0A1I6QR59_9RHOB|nr:FAD-binding oxidoreductase [Alloyangia pacifica]SDF95877.1 sarcosine oxidase subunit beta [Alloyangia pacifica]SFS54859.1 sarcosine oxidase subunit beta [Alloyangia pacifica]